MAACGGPIDWSAKAVGIWTVSVLIGCWSHLLVDLFTHAPPPAIGWLHWLSLPVGTFYGRELLVHTVMQVGVSAVAVVILLFAYRRFLGRQLAATATPPPQAATGMPALTAASESEPELEPELEPESGAGDRWRWRLHAALILGAGLAGLGYALITSPPITSWRVLEFQVFRLLVMATMIYIPALLLAALVAWRRRGSGRCRRGPSSRQAGAEAA